MRGARTQTFPGTRSNAAVSRQADRLWMSSTGTQRSGLSGAQSPCLETAAAEEPVLEELSLKTLSVGG